MKSTARDATGNVPPVGLVWLQTLLEITDTAIGSANPVTLRFGPFSVPQLDERLTGSCANRPLDTRLATRKSQTPRFNQDARNALVALLFTVGRRSEERRSLLVPGRFPVPALAFDAPKEMSSTYSDAVLAQQPWRGKETDMDTPGHALRNVPVSASSLSGAKSHRPTPRSHCGSNPSCASAGEPR
jgi:hypothetical protein